MDNETNIIYQVKALTESGALVILGCFNDAAEAAAVQATYAGRTRIEQMAVEYDTKALAHLA